MKTNRNGWGWMAVVVAILALPAATRGADVLVWTNSPSPGEPYSSWATAAHDIQTGVGYAGSNAIARVLVTNGTYYVTSAITITNPVTVESVAGPDVTIVDAQDAAGVRCFYLDDAGAVVDGFTIRNGRGTDYGGGIWLENGTVRNCTIVSNAVNMVADNNGGGIYMVNGLVSNCLIAANTAVSFANGRGGGVRMDGGTLAYCTISNNTADAQWRLRGGGLAMYGGTMLNCRVVANQALNGNNNADACGGGGVHMSGSSIMRNCLVLGNSLTGTASWGGGVRIDGGTLENCTIARNQSASPGGGGLYTKGGTVRNTIIYFNQAGNAPHNYCLSAGSSATYSCAPELTSGTGNTAEDALFVDSGDGYGTTFTNGDYRLQDASPCVNAGTTNGLSWLTSTSVDLDSGPRVVGAGIDMGAYETPPPPAR